MDQSRNLLPSNKAFLERDIQNYLENNPSTLGEILTIIGKEFAVPVGRIDLLAKDVNGNIVVIELKLGTANRDAIGQLQSYMGAIQSAEPNTFVRGLLVAVKLDSGAEAALRVARDIKFISYAITLYFKEGISSESTYGAWLAKRANSNSEIKPIWLPPGFKR
jgi:RecB family endonuclease NucS